MSYRVPDCLRLYSDQLKMNNVRQLTLELLIIAAERQRGSTLFLTLHEVLAFLCPFPGRIIYIRNHSVVEISIFAAEMSENPGGKLSNQVGF